VRNANRAPRIDRRRFVLGGGALTGLLLAGRWRAPLLARPVFAANPFSLGVASGDPLPDGVVLWTRLAPDPLNGGGMPSLDVAVDWEIAADEGLQRVVQRGTVIASARLAHAVHVEVVGLAAAHWYWYRFRVGEAVSATGRTRTAPAVGSAPGLVRFAVASCQNYEQGLFTAYQHMAGEELDFALHLGDYIYEGGATANRVRRHNGAEVRTLAAYRDRYALYKLDPDLQAAHAAFPFVVVWDDHEVSDNYAADLDKHGTPAAEFLLRRADAYQAYYEHQPLRLGSMPCGPDLLLYRRLLFGDLLALSVLDTRQYRTDQPCGDGVRPPCEGVDDPAQEMLGAAQERWLLAEMTASPARWNAIGQQVMMAPLDTRAGAEQVLTLDHWAGYPRARERVLRGLVERGVTNPLVLTGDVHANWVHDLRLDFARPETPVIATEFVGTSISSGGNGAAERRDLATVLAENPHIRFYNGQRGYVVCTVSPERWTAAYRVVSNVTAPGGVVGTRAAFVVEAGRSGAEPA